MTGAKSVPNLSRSTTGSNAAEKQENRKSKFGFHIPKVFKKNKKGDKTSNPSSPLPAKSMPTSTSSTSFDKQVSPAVTSSELPSLSAPSATLTIEGDGNISSEEKIDTAVVPIEQKEDTLNQENVNDAATEEAVVPFADKGLFRL